MNESLLSERLEKIIQIRPDMENSVLKLKEWIIQSDILEKYRINPYRLVPLLGVPVQTTAAILLYGVKDAVFSLHWDVHCPLCDMVTHHYSSLHSMKNKSKCRMCNQEFQPDFAERIEVSFSMHPEIENIDIPPFCPPPDSLKVYAETGAEFGQIGETETVLRTGIYRYFCPITNAKGVLTVSGEETQDLQEMKIHQKEDAYEETSFSLRPGRIRIEITNHKVPACGVFVIDENLSEAIPFEKLSSRLTGLQLIHIPEFQELFGDEILSDREGLVISSVTILFTDITGSTKMYEELGDIKAYNIVRDHFEILAHCIENEGGTVIKTIGDAVMASFLSPEKAVNAVFDAVRQFQKYNEPKSVKEQIYLKIGIHSGPAILVNLNERTDYFGTTVNTAARIQSMSEDNLFCVSENVFRNPNVIAVMKKYGIHRVKKSDRELKGLSGKYPVYFIPMILE
ncbi:MAG TPA: adenylate/guanylate cyclase domain-containing protein [Leptospiraceae bacterium]|nr:adenylate/guanylate cyclase domain-containing protein [Leptospiraceae bacterium]HMY66045.1 adenylate/guanylate cyclase domain-containing protein [Leptospiraceae bacterium]HNF15588.1 adenylate/guanylate cyclase domain-containing protein [Leptospiraceae bacterium]HNF25306.1 adenylate/guanylate cyclase domain-containing protein [Leptospiraceae bacterium]HNI25784.1 adenylate/guanylate cyclase domain-containing protein [Leptospiraceae bacterium]